MPAGKLTKIPRKPSTKVPEKIKNYVHKTISSQKETKFLTSAALNSELIATPTFTDVSSAISVGATDNDREGDIINGVSYQIKSVLARKTTATAGSRDLCRVIVLQWKPDSNVEPLNALSQILDTSGTAPYLAMPRTDYVGKSKFTILKDRSYILGSSLTDDTIQWFTCNIKSSRISKILYNDGSGTGKNHLWFVRFGANATGNESTTLDYHQRMKFKDA